jgi:hypothetical protein
VIERSCFWATYTPLSPAGLKPEQLTQNAAFLLTESRSVRRWLLSVLVGPKGTRTRQPLLSQGLTSFAKESIVTKRVPFGELTFSKPGIAVPAVNSKRRAERRSAFFVSLDHTAPSVDLSVNRFGELVMRSTQHPRQERGCIGQGPLVGYRKSL